MKLYPSEITNRQQRIKFVSIVAAGKVKRQGGDLLAQEHAGVYAGLQIKSGKSAATAIDLGHKAGMRVFNNILFRQQLI